MASFVSVYGSKDGASSADLFIDNEDIDIEGISPTKGSSRKITYENSLYNPADSLPGISNAKNLMDIASRTEDSRSDEAQAISKMSEQYQKNYDEAKAKEENAAKLKMASAAFRTGASIINANMKFDQISSQNAYNIRQAEIQALMVASNAKSKMLKEESKGKARGQSALISAVAQGQSAQGDLAKTAISNEDVYAAENAINMEINMMRQIFGIESQQRALALDTRLAEINRDMSINQAIIGGALDFGIAAYGG